MFLVEQRPSIAAKVLKVLKDRNKELKEERDSLKEELSRLKEEYGQAMLDLELCIEEFRNDD